MVARRLALAFAALALTASALPGQDFVGDFALYGQRGRVPVGARVSARRDAAGTLQVQRTTRLLEAGTRERWTTEEVRETPLGTSWIVTYRVGPEPGGLAGALEGEDPRPRVRAFYRFTRSGELRESLIHNQPGGPTLGWRFGRLLGRRVSPELAARTDELAARLPEAAVFALPGHGASDELTLRRLLELRDRVSVPVPFAALPRRSAAIGALLAQSEHARALRIEGAEPLLLLLGTTAEGDLLLVRDE